MFVKRWEMVNWKSEWLTISDRERLSKKATDSFSSNEWVRMSVTEKLMRNNCELVKGEIQTYKTI